MITPLTVHRVKAQKPHASLDRQTCAWGEMSNMKRECMERTGRRIDTLRSTSASSSASFCMAHEQISAFPKRLWDEQGPVRGAQQNFIRRVMDFKICTIGNSVGRLDRFEIYVQDCKELSRSIWVHLLELL